MCLQFAEQPFQNNHLLIDVELICLHHQCQGKAAVKAQQVTDFRTPNLTHHITGKIDSVSPEAVKPIHSREMSLAVVVKWNNCVTVE